MANISKPLDINKIWAASGDVLAPSDTKISQGWSVEIPPRQYFNYIDGKQDQAIAHINQHGIPVWDSVTEYQANTSYVQGTNGTVYKCLITNTNVNPIGDVSNSWRVAFLDSTSPVGPSVASAAQSRAQTDNSVFISPLQLANAFTSVSKQLLATNGYQVFPGGLIIQWANGSGPITTGTSASITFPIPFPNACFKVFTGYNGATNTSSNINFITGNPSNTSVVVYNASNFTGTPIIFAIGY